MKTIMSIVLVFAALATLPVMAQEWTCNYFLPQCPSKGKAYTNAINSVIEQRDAMKISMLEASKKMLEITKDIYPKDQTLISMREQSVEIAKLLSDSKISPDVAEKIRNASSDFYQRVIADRFEMAEAIGKMESNQQSRTQAGNNYANTAAVATMLNGIGRAFNNSFGQSITPPPQICNYYGGTRYCY